MESPQLTRLAGQFVDLMHGMGLRRDDMETVARLMCRHAALHRGADAPATQEQPLPQHFGPPLN